MESYDFMKADSVDMNKSGDESNLQHDISIDANISINSEDYENYINGEDFKITTESTDLNLSSLSKQSVASLPPSSSDTKTLPLEPDFFKPSNPESSGHETVDDILARYSSINPSSTEENTSCFPVNGNKFPSVVGQTVASTTAALPTAAATAASPSSRFNGDKE